MPDDAHHAGVGKHHAAIFHHHDADTGVFHDRAVTLLRLAQGLNRLVALDGTAKVVGHERQMLYIGFGILHTGLIALHYQHAAQAPPDLHGHAQPGGKGQIARRTGDLSAGLQFDEARCVNQLRLCGAQDKFCEASTERHMVTLQGVAIALIDVVGKVQRVVLGVVQAHITVAGIHELAQQFVHRTQKLKERQTGSCTLCNAVKNLVQRVRLLALERLMRCLQGLKTMFQLSETGWQIVGHRLQSTAPYCAMTPQWPPLWPAVFPWGTGGCHRAS